MPLERSNRWVKSVSKRILIAVVESALESGLDLVLESGLESVLN